MSAWEARSSPPASKKHSKPVGSLANYLLGILKGGLAALVPLNQPEGETHDPSLTLHVLADWGLGKPLVHHQASDFTVNRPLCRGCDGPAPSASRCPMATAWSATGPPGVKRVQWGCGQPRKASWKRKGGPCLGQGHESVTVVTRSSSYFYQDGGKFRKRMVLAGENTAIHSAAPQPRRRAMTSTGTPPRLVRNEGGPPPPFPPPLSIPHLSSLSSHPLFVGGGDPALPPSSPVHSRPIQPPPPPLGAAPSHWVPGSLRSLRCPAPPESVRRLPLGRGQEFRTDWQVGQGRCSCRQVLEFSNPFHGLKMLAVQSSPPRHLARSPCCHPQGPQEHPAALGEGSLAAADTEVLGHSDLGPVPRPR